MNRYGWHVRQACCAFNGPLFTPNISITLPAILRSLVGRMNAGLECVPQPRIPSAHTLSAAHPANTLAAITTKSKVKSPVECSKVKSPVEHPSARAPP